MATFKNPVTGVEMNPIPIERIHLDYDAAVTAWVLKLQGTKYNIIAHRLGVNTHRLGEVFRGEKWPSAQADALHRLTH